jgi:hypothetical protein
MVTVNLMGGVGNQIFQYAYSRALAAQGREVYLTNIQVVNVTDHRIYSLDGFNTVVKLYNPPPIGAAPFYESGLPFDPKMLAVPEPTIVYGYFQTEKYFLHIEDSIRKELSLKNPLSEKAQVLAKEIQNCNSVSLHVRRGDYLQLLAFHGMVDPSYYSAALEVITKQVSNSKVYIFSDDTKWCKENFTGIIVETGDKFEDLYLMSLCRHNVIVNSSFSWWAAWLNANPDKIVVAPREWFSSKDLDSRDVVPEKWLKI